MGETVYSQNKWVPLVDYRRNGVAECTIHGSIAWVSGSELIHSFGGNVTCYGRSMMKPYMVKVFAKELEDLSWEQKAIAVASHNGDTEHIRVVTSILSESELGLLQTPLALPLMQFGQQRRRPRRLYHSCSGEHAAICVVVRKKVGRVWVMYGPTMNFSPPISIKCAACWEKIGNLK